MNSNNLDTEVINTNIIFVEEYFSFNLICLEQVIKKRNDIK